MQDLEKICPTLRNSFIRKFYIKLQSWQTVLIVSDLLCFTFLFNLLCALVFILSMVRLLTNFLIDHVANWGGYIFTPLFIKRFTWFPMAFRFIGAIWSNLLCRDHLGLFPTFRCTIVRRTVEWIFCSSTSTSINRNKVRHSTLPTCGLCCHKYLQKKEISIVLLVRQKARRKSNGLNLRCFTFKRAFLSTIISKLNAKVRLGYCADQGHSENQKNTLKYETIIHVWGTWKLTMKFVTHRKTSEPEIPYGSFFNYVDKTR